MIIVPKKNHLRTRNNSTFISFCVFRMNQKMLALACLVCVFAVPVLSTVELAIGGLALTATQTTLLGAGLLGAKLLGVGVGAGLASKGVRIISFN